MRADSYLFVERAADWTGLSLTNKEETLLVRYHAWLVEEAVAAGGIGPNETDRLWSRHIADAVLFAIGLDDARSCLDIGSGVGLPGIPLAIVRSEIGFWLVDRSGRRCDLMKRAIAVLGLDNCHVIHGDIGSVDKKFDSIVSRASLPPEQAMIHVKRLLRSEGTAVIGLSRVRDPSDPIDFGPGWHVSVVDVPPEILDSSVYLLRIGAS